MWVLPDTPPDAQQAARDKVRQIAISQFAEVPGWLDVDYWAQYSLIDYSVAAALPDIIAAEGRTHASGQPIALQPLPGTTWTGSSATIPAPVPPPLATTTAPVATTEAPVPQSTLPIVGSVIDEVGKLPVIGPLVDKASTATGISKTWIVLGGLALGLYALGGFGGSASGRRR